MNGKVFVGQKALSLTEYDKSAPISGVILWVDDENCYEAGDDTGTVIEQDCPYATQQMANNLLATLQGYSYQGLEANGAKVSPIAELGDGITVNGLYTQLAYQNIRFSTGEVMDVAAPGKTETLHEYQTEGYTTQQFTHQIAETRSEIRKTSEDITLLVENEIQGLSSQFTVQLGQITAELTDEINGLSASVDLKFDGLETSFEDKLNGLSADFDVKLNGLQANFEDEINGLSSTLNVKIDGIEASLEDEINGLSSSINLQIDSITSTVQGQGGQISQIQQTVTGISSQVSGLDGQMSSITQTVSSITSQVNGLDGQVSTIEQKVDNITLSVSNGSTSSSISLSVGGVVVSSQNIQMNGLVTFTGLANGTTTIDGGCIKTGTISANRLDLTGAISFGDLTSSLQTRITDAQDAADAAQTTANDVEDTVSGWTYRGTTYIDGSMIQTGTVVASMLLGGEIRLLTDDKDFAGYIALSGASSASYKVIYGGLGATQVVAENGDLYLEAMSGYVTLDGSDGITAKNDFYPSSDGRYNLGDPNFYWDNVYANTSPATSSDRNRKNSITYDMSKYSTLFDALRPTPYKLNDGTSGRTHLGLIAQDVEEAMMSCGISTLSFAGLIKSYTGDGNYRYAIRYDEIIAMLIYEVQQLKSRVATLEGA